MTIIVDIDQGRDVLGLADCNGNVTECATRLGIHRQSLQRKMRRHGLGQPEST